MSVTKIMCLSEPNTRNDQEVQDDYELKTDYYPDYPDHSDHPDSDNVRKE
ncbi:MAG: hypothetical protein GY795_15535 [Desulfobacterales bacterium]|nr:hypothetical protein [Desulfobacterales bacterium]